MDSNAQYSLVGLRSCANDKHIHIDCNKDLISRLIARAEPEIQDSRRERHAKTLDIAQEEILTCIGIYLFERFEKICRTMRSEEQIWQLLFYIGIDCLRLSRKRRSKVEREKIAWLFFRGVRRLRNDGRS